MTPSFRDKPNYIENFQQSYHNPKRMGRARPVSDEEKPRTITNPTNLTNTVGLLVRNLTDEKQNSELKVRVVREVRG
jgi:hypothetical protein